MTRRPLSTENEYEWPRYPYKGLTFYSEDDVPLFAGRDSDIDSVCESIGLGSIRILLLHGLTGCGKSSFLRAGLIPALEEEIAGYEFLRDEYGRPDFVRSTDDPVASLARRVYRFIKRENLSDPKNRRRGFRDITNTSTPRAERSDSSLQKRRAGTAPSDSGLSEEDFLHAVALDPNKLVKLVEQIASQIPRTFVLVIDQAEEVITLKPEKSGDAARIQFFDFLSDISRSRFDLKVIICFRTEYHGQFYAQLRYGADVSRINDYYLPDFNEEQIIEAILRPTSTECIRGYGSPQEIYNFEYEEGLPKTIAKELLASGLSGGVLPALQLVCRRLYEGLQPKPQEQAASGERRTASLQFQIASSSHDRAQSYLPLLKIRDAAFTTLGGVAGQVISYLESELDAALKEPFAAGVEVSAQRNEIDRWRKVLTTLVKSQINGTVTTDIIPDETLRLEARDQGCQIEPSSMFEFLNDERRRILRFVDITNLNTKEVIRCCSLGHDVLAGAFEEWSDRVRREQTSAGVTFRSARFNSSINGKSYALNAITPIKPWNTPILRVILFFLEAVKPLTQDVKRLSFISFARWIIVKRARFPRLSKQQSRERLQYDYLIFICSLNVTWDQFVGSISAVVPKWFNLIYGLSHKFPGSRPVTPFRQYFTNVQFATDYYYTAYPLATTSDVKSAHRVVSAFKELQSRSHDMSDEDFQIRYLEFVLRVQEDLGGTGMEPFQVEPPL